MSLERTKSFPLQFVKNNTITILLFLFCSFTLAAQKSESKVDTTQSETNRLDQLSSKINRMAATELEKSKANYKHNKITQKQNNNFILINSEIQKANSTLKQGIDYKGFTKQINKFIAWRDFAVDGIITNRDEIQTNRNLTSTSLLLNEILNGTDNRLNRIKSDYKLLGEIQKKIDSLASDKDLYVVPKDSVGMLNYFQQLTFMTKDIEKLHVNLKNAIDSIQKLQIQGDLFKNSLESNIIEIEVERKNIFENYNAGKKDFSIQKTHTQQKSFYETIIYSFNKGILLLIFYFLNHNGYIFGMAFFIIAITIYLSILKNKYKKANLYKELNPGHIFQFPLASSFLVTITIYQFFLPLPPFIVSGLIWIISSIALVVILWKSVSPYWFRVWLVFFTLNLLAIFDNLILRYSVFESRFILILSCVGFGFGLYILKKRRSYIKENTILAAIILMIIFEILAAYFILNGQYNVSKLLMTNGFFAILLGFLMVWTYRLTNDMFVFSFNLKEKDDEKDEKLIESTNHKIPFIIYLAFFAGWFVLTTKNSYLFQKFIEPFKFSFAKPRTFGEFSFSYENIFIFFFVLFISGFISKVVAFSTKENRFNEMPVKKNSIGSWVLLIRIAVMTLGVVIAFVSAGIPMDRIAIIIGALGVGIGFGLQALVNNLISGVIIAFEKPVNLDDIVEIGGKTGKMKSIGIRSSVITTWDGADVIIPNGDLMNQHLVNWTLGSSKSRFTIKLGVAYGTDLGKTKHLLMQLMEKNPKILFFPQPIVLITEFNDSSIDLSIRFWVPDFNIGLDVKSDLILEIDTVFKEHGIVIPFPQQDVHIKSNSTFKADEKKSTSENEKDS